LERQGTRWTHFGDTVDIAFLALAAKAGLSHRPLLRRYPQVAAIPYEPARKYAATFNRVGDRLRVHVKGAIEVVLPRCGSVDRAAVLSAAEAMAAEGFRVLAVAAGPV